MRRIPVLVAMFGIIGTAPVGDLAAQIGGDPELHREAMTRLDFLTGEWEGDGWLMMPEGRIEIRQYESVRYELGGTILLIEGTARERSGREIGEVIFNAFAVIQWTEGDGYSMRSYLWNGLVGDRSIEVGDASFTWGQQTPGGPVRYDMVLDEDGAWHEVGHIRRGDREFPIIEFRVSKR